MKGYKDMTDAEKIMAIKRAISAIFDNNTDNTPKDRACRNIARSLQLIVEPDIDVKFESVNE